MGLMTIDERLEALTQTMGLLAQLHKDNEVRMGDMMQAITRLSNTAAVHNIQIDDHEKRIGEIEQGRPRH